MSNYTFPEKYKIIRGVEAGTTCGTGSTGDWVNCKNFHRIYAIADLSVITASAVTFNWLRGNTAGGGDKAVATTGSKWWSNLTVGTSNDGFDRLIPRTTSDSSYTVGSSTGHYQVVSMFDCASLPSSHWWVAFEHHTEGQGANMYHQTYIAEKRYPQSVDLIATTSST